MSPQGAYCFSQFNTPNLPSSRATKRDDAGRAKRLAAARKAESTARRAADRAARELETAQGHRDQLARSLREAEDALAAARERAKDAERKHRRARQGLDGL